MVAKSKWIVAASAFFGALALGTGLVAQQGAGGGAGQGQVPGVAPSIKSLIEARIGVAKEIFEAAMAPPQNAPLDDLPAWSRRWMDDEISLDPGPDPVRRLAAIRGHLERIETLEKIAITRREQARGSQANVLKLRYYRLEAEQMIEELRIINPGLFAPKPADRP